MNDVGIFVVGYFAGSEVRIRDGKTSYYYLISIGATPYRVRSENDYRPDLKFGDEVAFRVTINAFNNSFYLSGDLYEIDK
jgi:acyl-CoA thioesterase FadM